MTWFAEIHAGEPILVHFFGPTVVYTIEGSEVLYTSVELTQYILGEFFIEEKFKPDQITKLVAGDVFHMDEASYLTWTSPNGGKGK